MGTTKGHGKYITPEQMWNLFKEYEQHAKDNPILEHDFVGKDATEVERKRHRAISTEGFYEFVADHPDTKITHPDLSDYFENKDGRYEDYVRICSRIKRRVRVHQIEGGMAGIYNPSITQRLNGLADNLKTDLKANVSVLNIDPLDTE